MANIWGCCTIKSFSWSGHFTKVIRLTVCIHGNILTAMIKIQLSDCCIYMFIAFLKVFQWSARLRVQSAHFTQERDDPAMFYIWTLCNRLALSTILKATIPGIQISQASSRLCSSCLFCHEMWTLQRSVAEHTGSSVRSALQNYTVSPFFPGTRYFYDGLWTFTLIFNCICAVSAAYLCRNYYCRSWH